MMSILPTTSKCSCTPRPVLPMKPLAWLSSTNTIALYFSASAHDLVERREVAVHAEHAVGDDQPHALVLVLLELLLQVLHVGVLVGVLHRLAQAHAVDDAGVDQAVGDHDVLVVQDRLEHAAVGVHAAREEDRVLGAEELGQLVLELAVQVLRAADEPDARHPVAALVEAAVRRRHHLRVRRQARGSCSSTGSRRARGACPAGNSTEMPAACGEWMNRSCLKMPLLADRVQFGLVGLLHDGRICHR